MAASEHPRKTNSGTQGCRFATLSNKCIQPVSLSIHGYTSYGVYIATNINTDKPCVLIFVNHRVGPMEQLQKRNKPVEQ